jgi:hypothetical protein
LIGFPLSLFTHVMLWRQIEPPRLVDKRSARPFELSLSPEPRGSEAALSATTAALSPRARALRNNAIVSSITPGSNALNCASAVLHYLDYTYAPPLSCMLDFLLWSTFTINSTRQTTCHVLAPRTIVAAVSTYIIRLVEDPRNLLLAV